MAYQTAARLLAFETWVQWTSRSDKNPVLNWAWEQYLAPLGIVSDHVRFNPSGLLDGHYPALDIVGAEWSSERVRHQELKVVLGQLAEVSSVIESAFDASPLALVFGIDPDVPKDHLTETAVRLIGSGINAQIAGLLEDAEANFRDCVSAYYGAMCDPHADDDGLRLLTKDPVSFCQKFEELRVREAAQVPA